MRRINVFAVRSILDINVPGGADKVLLHTCCAPCSSAIIECMMGNGVTPVIYYCNPNIFPEAEYDIRRNECARYAQSLGIAMIDAGYSHEAWLRCVSGMEDEPERGRRCMSCFKMRLAETALYASGHGFKVMATTLASSRWKSVEQVNEAGRWAADRVPGVTFWARNWRKGGLTERRAAIIRQFAFYNQQYCGCEFSLRAREARVKYAVHDGANAGSALCAGNGLRQGF